MIPLRLTATIAAIALNAAPGYAQTPIGAVPFASDRVPAEVRPLDDGRTIVLYREAFRGYMPAGASAVELRNADGSAVWERRPGLDVKEATTITVLDSVLSPGGQVVVSMVAARPGASTAHILAYYSLGGSRNIRLAVVPHACFRISPAAAEGIWCLGPHVEKHNSRRADFQILHHYSEDGRLLASIGERTAFAGVRPWDSQARMRSLGGSVIIWMPSRRELVTIGTDGIVASTVQVAEPPIIDQRTDYVLTPNGKLLSLAITHRPGSNLASWRRGLFVYDTETEAWRPTTITGLSLAVRLVGSAGGAVTFWDRERPRLLKIKP